MSKASLPTRLDGRVALVTAGDTPMGRNLAAALAAAGADVAVAYLNDHAAAAETRRVIEDKGHACLVLPADLSLESECARVVGRTVHRFGSLDLLALVPPIGPEGETVLDVPPCELEALVRAPLQMARSALPYMSCAVLVAEPASACFTSALARALEKKGVEVTALNSQWFQT